MSGDNLSVGDLLTVTDVAQQSGVSRDTIDSWITRGLLPALRIDGRRYIQRTDLAVAQTRARVAAVASVWRHDQERAGKRLRSLREAARLTQLQLAAASSLTHETISRTETGRQGASTETVLQLAHALRVEPERFVRRKPIGLTMLTVVEAACRLDVPARRVQTWLREGLLAGVKISGQWRVPIVVVEELERSERLRGRSRRLDPRFRG